MRGEHGGNLEEFCRKFQIPMSGVLDFSSNVTPLGLPEKVRMLYPQLLEKIPAYPDSEAKELCGVIAEQESLACENVIAGNGSMAVMALVIRALAPKSGLLIEPCFSEYRRLLELQGAQIQSVLLREEESFEFSLDKILTALPGKDFLILGHPNNPTGTALKPQELLKLLAICHERGIFVVVDEAFVDWTPEISVAPFLNEGSSFLILRSLTKFYGLAGIRAGYGLASRRVIKILKDYQEPWGMNVLAQALSVAALEDQTFRSRSLAWFGGEKNRFEEKLRSLEGYRVFLGCANFFLLKTSARHVPGTAEDLFEFCGQQGIYIRLLRDFPGLENYFRVALRTDADNEKLLTSLREALRFSTSLPASGRRSGVEKEG